MAALTSLNIFKAAPDKQNNEFSLLPLAEYDRFLIFYSGGKDSNACVLHLLELGVPPSKIELHHHLVDGDSDQFMDWPVTRDYCRAFADALGLRYTESWREGGFRAEMLKHESRSLPITFIDGQGNKKLIGGTKGKISTRRMFPQVSGSLSVRYCSASLKIDVGNAFIRHTPRFNIGKTLVITGERSDEGGGRKYYETELIHSTSATPQYETVVEAGEIVRKMTSVKRSKKRWVDHWRPIHKWSEQEVWAIMQRHGISAHPAYHCGFNRCSCSMCIFLKNNSLATIRDINKSGFTQMANYEQEFGVLIDRKNRTVNERADAGTAYKFDQKMAKLAMSDTYDVPIKTDPADWVLPLGAYGENDGPK